MVVVAFVAVVVVVVVTVVVDLGSEVINSSRHNQIILGLSLS